MTYFFQIYWRDDQAKEFFEWTLPYKNEGLTPFFENSVIIDIFDRYMFNSDDKIGVFSWNLRNKMKSNVPPYRKLSLEVIESDYDVLSFTKNTVNHGMLHLAENWHKGFWEIINEIWVKLGFGKAFEAKYPIYQNAFMARYDVYNTYLKEVLRPAMELMENDPSIKEKCWKDSNYYKLKGSQELSERVKKYLGVNYCPMHTFLCERMFSLWLNDRNLKVVYL